MVVATNLDYWLFEARAGRDVHGGCSTPRGTPSLVTGMWWSCTSDHTRSKDTHWNLVSIAGDEKSHNNGIQSLVMTNEAAAD